MRGLKAPLSSQTSPPKIDLAGCVFYAPFWRPDMVARGGSIKSGTGTMAVTPLTLAVGANTVTALTAGTFIITVPQAGTCASNGATIIGSTVTLPAGVATTVDTGVTTGTFTVTTGNIIRSKDSLATACTFVGATWGSQGRLFDYIDDYISCGNIPSYNITTAITIEMWAKRSRTTSDDTERTIIKDDGASGGYALSVRNNKYHFALYIDGGWRFTDSGTWADTNWHHVVGTYNSTSKLYRIIQDTTVIDSETLGGLASYTIATIDSNLWIGCRNGLGTFFSGTVGEVRIYNRELSIQGITHNYQATKWRYV